MSTPITTAGWSRPTGSVVGRPASGSRTTALAKPEAAAFGAPGTDDHRRRPRGAGVEEALAGRIREQHLEHGLGRAVGRQRRLARAVVDGAERQLAAERRERAREHQPRCAAVGPAGLHERATAVQVDVQREVEVALGAAAHDRGEVDDRDLGAVERRAQQLRVANVAAQHEHVGEVVGRRDRRGDVEQEQLVLSGRVLRRRRASSTPSMPRPPVITMRIGL